MSNVDALLSRLDKVRKTGRDSWMACCPAHPDKNPSLTIRETEDGRILVHDHGQGCSVHEIVAAVGLELTDLFPPRPAGHRHAPERRPFPAADCLRAVAFEALVVSAAAAAILAGEPFDRDRLILATSRIQSALSASGVNNHGTC
jgi:hypothetical protein